MSLEKTSSEENSSDSENHREELKKKVPLKENLPGNQQEGHKVYAGGNVTIGKSIQAFLKGIFNVLIIIEPSPSNSQLNRFIRYVAAGVYVTFVIGGFIKLWTEGYASPFTLILLIIGGVLLSLTCCYYAYFWEPSHVPPPRTPPVKPIDSADLVDLRFWPDRKKDRSEKERNRVLANREKYKEEYEQVLTLRQERKERYMQECKQYEQELKQYEQHEQKRNKLLRQVNIRRRLAAILMVSIPFSIACGVLLWWNTPPNTIVAFAEYYGSDPIEVNKITGDIRGRLEEDTNRKDRVITIKRIKRAFTDSDEEYAIREGRLRRATIAIWGSYEDEGDNKRYAVDTTFSLLKPPLAVSTPLADSISNTAERLSVEGKDRDWSKLSFFQHIPKEVNGKTKSNVSNETVYLTSFTSGLAHYKAKLWQSAIDRFRTALVHIRRVEQPNSGLDQSIVLFYLSNAYIYNAHFSKSENGYDLAISGFTNAIELVSEFSLIPYNQSNLEIEKRDYAAVLASYKISQNESGLDKNDHDDDQERICGRQEHDTNILVDGSPQQLKKFLARIYNNRGIAYAMKGDNEQALADYKQAYQLDPEVGGLCAGFGTAYAEDGNYRRAIPYLERAISVNPQDAIVHNNLGNIYASQSQDHYTNQKYQLALDEYKRAITEYTTAIQLKPDFAEAYYNRGRTHFIRKENEALSIQDFNKAIQLKPNFADIYYYGRGEDYLARKEYDRAIENFEKATERNSNFAEAYYRLAEAYYSYYRYRLGESESASEVVRNSNNFDKAIENFKEAIKLKPDFAEAYYRLGEIDLDREEYAEAVEDFETATELKPELKPKFIAEHKSNLTKAYLRLGEKLLSDGNYTQATEYLDKAFELNPSSVEVYYNRGRIYFEQGNNSQAIATLNQAIQLKSDYTEAYTLRADAYRLQDDYDEAIKDLKQAISINPNYGNSYYVLGLIYNQQGNSDKAIENFTKVANSDANPKLKEEAEENRSQICQENSYSSVTVKNTTSLNVRIKLLPMDDALSELVEETSINAGDTSTIECLRPGKYRVRPEAPGRQTRATAQVDLKEGENEPVQVETSP